MRSWFHLPQAASRTASLLASFSPARFGKGRRQHQRLSTFAMHVKGMQRRVVAQFEKTSGSGSV